MYKICVIWSFFSRCDTLWLTMKNLLSKIYFSNKNDLFKLKWSASTIYILHTLAASHHIWTSISFLVLHFTQKDKWLWNMGYLFSVLLCSYRSLFILHIKSKLKYSIAECVFFAFLFKFNILYDSKIMRWRMKNGMVFLLYHTIWLSYKKRIIIQLHQCILILCVSMVTAVMSCLMSIHFPCIYNI